MYSGIDIKPSSPHNTHGMCITVYTLTCRLWYCYTYTHTYTHTYTCAHIHINHTHLQATDTHRQYTIIHTHIQYIHTYTCTIYSYTYTILSYIYIHIHIYNTFIYNTHTHTRTQYIRIQSPAVVTPLSSYFCSSTDNHVRNRSHTPSQRQESICSMPRSPYHDSLEGVS